LDLLHFYSRAELHLKQIKFTRNALSQQIIRQESPTTINSSFHNSFLSLFEDELEDTMDIDDNDQRPPSAQPKKVSWSMDTSIASLTEDIFSHMTEKKQKDADSGDLDLDSPDYKKPHAQFEAPEKLNQFIHFNLIRHKGAVGDTKVGQLFRSFASTLKKADPSIVIHPFQVSKQHFSSLATLKQIQVVDDTKIHQFFQSHHQKQTYSLSGYFNISSALTFSELFHLTLVAKWLESYHYYARICPSQNEEMVKIGALVYSSIFIF
jgi:hypothetical protein